MPRSVFRGILFSNWVPGELEAKSWGTHIRLGITVTVGDSACRSMRILVALLLWFSCYTATTHGASASDNKQQCCWLSMSIGSSGGTAVSSAALVAAPFVWRYLLAVAPVCCFASLLCCLTVWYQKLYALLCIRRYFGLELFSAIVCHF